MSLNSTITQEQIEESKRLINSFLKDNLGLSTLLDELLDNDNNQYNIDVFDFLYICEMKFNIIIQKSEYFSKAFIRN